VALVAIRAIDFINVGKFDEEYFAHWEEIALAMKFRRLGKRLCCISNSVVYHLGGGTLNVQMPQKTYLNFRNNLQSILIHIKAGRAVQIFLFRLFADGLAGIQFAINGKFSHILAIARAHWYVFFNLNGILKKRKNITALLNAPYLSFPGSYDSWIIWDYYIRKKWRFEDLKFETRK